MDEHPIVERETEPIRVAPEAGLLLEQPVVAGVNLSGKNQESAGKARSALDKLNAATTEAEGKSASDPQNETIAQAATALSKAVAAGDKPAQLKPLVEALLAALEHHGHSIKERSAGAPAGGQPPAGGQNPVNKANSALAKAQAALNKALTDLSQIEKDISKAGTDVSNIANASNAGQVANGIAGVLNDIGDALDAVGDLVGGPVGAAISAIGGALESLASFVSSTFGDNQTGQTGNTDNNTDNNNTDNNNTDDPPPNQGEPGEGEPGEGDPEGGGCFTPATTVLMADGSNRPIGDIEVGDLVMARDERTSRTDGRPVSHVFRHVVGETLLLRLKNGEEIETTKVHRFATDGGVFVDAGTLQPGSRLATLEIDGAEVDRSTPRIGRFEVLNLEVDSSHTFFVGDSALWVHNLKDEHTNDDDHGDDGDDQP